MKNTSSTGFTVNPTELKNAQGELQKAQGYWNDIALALIEGAPIPPEVFSAIGIMQGTPEKYVNGTLFLTGMASSGGQTLGLAAWALGNVNDNYVQTDNSNAGNLSNNPVKPNG